MKKITLLFAVIVLCLCSCKSVEPTAFQPDYQNPQLLPNLAIWFDVTSFENAFDASSYSEDGSTCPPSTYGKGVFQVNEKTKIYTSEKRIQDACNLWVYDVKNNICTPTGKKCGNIVLRVGNAYKRNNYKWSWLSGFTVGTLNVLGMPMCSNHTEIEVIVEIYDFQNHLIAKFNERGTAKEYMAAYYGYYEFQRKSASVALEDGIIKIKELINKDYPSIAAKLR